MVVQFRVAVSVQDQPMRFGADRFRSARVGDRTMAGRGGIFKKREKGLSMTRPNNKKEPSDTETILEIEAGDWIIETCDTWGIPNVALVPALGTIYTVR